LLGGYVSLKGSDGSAGVVGCDVDMFGGRVDGRFEGVLLGCSEGWIDGSSEA